MIKNVYWSACRVRVILDRFKYKLNFLDNGSKNTQISYFMTIRPVGAELFHAERRTDRHEAESRLSQLCERAYSV
jgi:hypothetical protein